MICLIVILILTLFDPKVGVKLLKCGVKVKKNFLARCAPELFDPPLFHPRRSA